jgi:hypothetical protein
MAVDERAWRGRYDDAERALGSVSADTMMALLPPRGADVATKSDIAELHAKLQAQLDSRIAEVRTEIARAVADLRKTIIWLIGSMFAIMMATVVSLVVPLVTLT